ncbi:MAG: hypothetical protein IK115_04750 [Lachnospiraceae bacterium]|nr:hypothetical protein [Lachnospiraceae bacterium]
MKKKILVMALAGALAVTALAGCGKEEESPSKETKTEAKKDKDKDKKENKEPASMKGDDEEEEYDLDIDESEYLDGLIGEWQLVDDEAETTDLTVYSQGGSYYFDLVDNTVGGYLSGTVELEYEEHPDDTYSLWYMFYDTDGDMWEGFYCDPDNQYPAHIYSGQDGELDFERISYGETDEEDQGRGSVEPYFFLGKWGAGQYWMEIIEGDKEGYYYVTIECELDDTYHLWEYNCSYDDYSEALYCGYGEYYVFDMDQNGDLGAKHQQYDDGTGTFFFNDEGIVWDDSEDPSHRNMTFEFISE